MPRRPLTLMALLAVLGVAWLGMPGLSSASFTATSKNAVSTVTASADWTPPVVALRNPGTAVKGTVPVVADASDSGTGVANVTIEYLAPGASAWTTLCTTATSPYTCSWATANLADGGYSLRATALDNAGYSTTSDVLTTTVANNLLVVLGDPGDIVKGIPTLTTSLYNQGALPYTVSVQYQVSGTTGTWKTLCSATQVTSPYTCTWNTATNPFVQGESYDLRSVASAAGIVPTYSATVLGVMVDNVAPAVTMTDPGTPLRGTSTFTATATDADAGVAQVQLQYQRSTTSTWTTFCTVVADPYSCRFDTTGLADGTYAFRAIATDAIGNATTSASVTGRVVDNTVSSVSVEDPGAYLGGSVTLRASAASSAGIASVRIERASNGSSTWTAVCTDTTAPYTCTWDTTTVADGLYDLRAILTDGQGRTLTSTVLAARRVDNTPLRGYDVQGTNGGAQIAKLDAGDTLRLTYTQLVSPGTISTGWTGASIPVTLRLRDALVLGSSGNNDTLDIQRNGSTVNLGSINLKQNYIKNNKTTTFNATMVATTSTVAGQSATVVTITVGTLASGGSLRAPGAAAAMVWTPSALATDPNGSTCSAGPVTESGTLDKDF
jgi:hypothetical protein